MEPGTLHRIGRNRFCNGPAWEYVVDIQNVLQNRWTRYLYITQYLVAKQWGQEFSVYKAWKPELAKERYLGVTLMEDVALIMCQVYHKKELLRAICPIEAVVGVIGRRSAKYELSLEYRPHGPTVWVLEYELIVDVPKLQQVTYQKVKPPRRRDLPIPYRFIR